MQTRTGPGLRRKLGLIGRSRAASFFLITTLSILASAVLTAPFYYRKPPGSEPNAIRLTQDLAIHLAVIEQFDKVLRSGAVYPRWLPDVNYGYGNAWPNFYQPGFYYLTSLVHAITNNWVDTLFIITTLGLAASGFAFNVLARMFFGKMASAAAAVIYVLLPYHLIDFYQRGAMPEFLSFVLMPLILYFFIRVGRQGRARSYAGLGLCYGLCLMVHVPIAYLFSYLLVLYAAAWAGMERDWKIAGRIALGMTLGVLLSAIYWIPAVLEIRYATETVTEIFKYSKSYITEAPDWDLFARLLIKTLAIQSSALLIAAAVLQVLKRRASGRLDSPAERDARFSHSGMWIVLGLIAIFMNLPSSYFLARLIPKIEVVAFSWRWLAFVCFFASLLIAAALDQLIRVRSAVARPLYVVAAAATVIVIAVNICYGSLFFIASFSQPVVQPYDEFPVDTYCPKGVVSSMLPRTERIVVEPNTGTSEVIRWEPLRREVIITTSEPTTARLKTFNFPGWTARIDGRDAPISNDAVCAQLVDVPAGTHTVEITFSGTLPRTIGSAVSIVGALMICALVMADYFGVRRQRRRFGLRLKAKTAN